MESDDESYDSCNSLPMLEEERCDGGSEAVVTAKAASTTGGGAQSAANGSAAPPKTDTPQPKRRKNTVVQDTPDTIPTAPPTANVQSLLNTCNTWPKYLSKAALSSFKPHQVEGVEFMWKNIVVQKEGCILAHAMGLGKTCQLVQFILAFSKHMKETEADRSTKGKVRCVVLCATSLVATWRMEVAKWLRFEDPDSLMSVGLRDIRIFSSEIPASQREQSLKVWSENGGVLIVTYPRLQIEAESIQLAKAAAKESGSPLHSRFVNLEERLFGAPSLVILDEAQTIKNESSKTARACAAFSTARRIAVTGTPLENNAKELLNLVEFVRPHRYNMEAFAKITTDIEGSAVKHASSFDIQKTESHAALLIEKFGDIVHRRDKAILMDALPPLSDCVVRIRLSPLQENLYTFYARHVKRLNALAKRKEDRIRLFEFRAMCNRIIVHPSSLYHAYRNALNNPALDSDDAALSLEAKKKKQLYSWLDKTDFIKNTYLDYSVGGCSGTWEEASPKLRAVKCIVTSAVLSGEKVLIFSGFVEHLNMVKEYLLQGGSATRIETMTGSDSPAVRANLIEAMQNQRIDCLLMTMGVGSVGLTVTAATRVIILETTWNWASVQQAIFRTYRYGQTRPVYVYRLISDGSIEDKLLSTTLKKAWLHSRLVENESLTRDHLQEHDVKDYYEPCDSHRAPTVIPQTVLNADAFLVSLASLTRSPSSKSEDKELSLRTHAMEKIKDRLVMSCMHTKDLLYAAPELPEDAALEVERMKDGMRKNLEEETGWFTEGMRGLTDDKAMLLGAKEAKTKKRKASGSGLVQSSRGSRSSPTPSVAKYPSQQPRDLQAEALALQREEEQHMPPHKRPKTRAQPKPQGGLPKTRSAQVFDIPLQPPSRLPPTRSERTNTLPPHEVSRRLALFRTLMENVPPIPKKFLFEDIGVKLYFDVGKILLRRGLAQAPPERTPENVNEYIDLVMCSIVEEGVGQLMRNLDECLFDEQAKFRLGSWLQQQNLPWGAFRESAENEARPCDTPLLESIRNASMRAHGHNLPPAPPESLTTNLIAHKNVSSKTELALILTQTLQLSGVPWWLQQILGITLGFPYPRSACLSIIAWGLHAFIRRFLRSGGTLENIRFKLKVPVEKLSQAVGQQKIEVICKEIIAEAEMGMARARAEEEAMNQTEVGEQGPIRTEVAPNVRPQRVQAAPSGVQFAAQNFANFANKTPQESEIPEDRWSPVGVRGRAEEAMHQRAVGEGGERNNPVPVKRVWKPTPPIHEAAQNVRSQRVQAAPSVAQLTPQNLAGLANPKESKRPEDTWSTLGLDDIKERNATQDVVQIVYSSDEDDAMFDGFLEDVTPADDADFY